MQRWTSKIKQRQLPTRCRPFFCEKGGFTHQSAETLQFLIANPFRFVIKIAEHYELFLLKQPIAPTSFFLNISFRWTKEWPQWSVAASILRISAVRFSPYRKGVLGPSSKADAP